MYAGTTELRLNLSKYLKRVRNGERVVITDRGEPVAELVPFQRQRADDAVSAHIAYLAGRGYLTLPKSELAAPVRPVKPVRGVSPAVAADAVVRDREEGQ